MGSLERERGEALRTECDLIGPTCGYGGLLWEIADLMNRRMIAIYLGLLLACFGVGTSEAAEAKDLVRKYQNLLLLQSGDEQTAPVLERVLAEGVLPDLEAAVKAVKSYPYEHEGEIAFYDFKVFAESEVSDDREAQEKVNQRFSTLFSHHLPLLAYAYQTPGKNPYYQNEEVLGLYLRGMEYCYSRGLTEKAWMTDHAGRASGRALKSGLAREGGDFSSVSLHFGGFIQAIFLMREPLAEAGLLEKYRGVARNLAVNNGAMYMAFFEYARGDAGIDYLDSAISEQAYLLNADGVRLFVDYFIPYFLLIEDADERERMTRILKAVIAMNIALKPGTQDTIKPDGVGFHHSGAYVGGYSPYAFESFATLLYLVSGTDYYTQENLDAVKLALESFRVMAQKYTVSTSLQGRLLSGNNEAAAVAISKSMALLAHPDGLADASMQARFLEFFDRDYFFKGKQLAEYYQGKRGVPIRGLGIYRLIADVRSQGGEAAEQPSGTWIKPYAASGFFRRDDWLVTAKGFSRYFWDYEGPLNKQQNSFGQNWAYGLLQVFSAGEPISETGSGYDLANGWDWYHVPGTTASHYPVEKRSEKQVRQAREEDGVRQRSIHRNYSSRTFVGGLSLGANGLFVQDLEGVPFTSPTDLRAWKSYFFVGDKALALGSRISGGTDADETHTTLFQTRLEGSEVPTLFNGDSLRGLGVAERLAAGGVAAMTDSVGNSFYLADSSAELSLSRKMQRSLTPRYQPTQGAYAQAILNHGIKPVEDFYQYVVIPADRDGRKLRQLAGNPSAYFEVVEKDRMHLVRFPEQKLVAYAFYELFETPEPYLVKSANLNAVVMTQRQGRSIELAASVPDLGWDSDWDALEKGGLSYASRHYAQQEAKEHSLKLALRGRWKLAADVSGARLTIEGDETMLEMSCSDGLSRKVELVPADR